MGAGTNVKQKLVHTCSRKLSYSDFTAASGTTVDVGTIPKGSRILNTTVFLVTAFTATSASFLVGSSGDDDMVVAAGDVGELTAGVYQILTSRMVLTSDLAVKAKMTWGTAMTVGELHVVIEFDPPVNYEDNPTLFDT